MSTRPFTRATDEHIPKRAPGNGCPLSCRGLLQIRQVSPNESAATREAGTEDFATVFRCRDIPAPDQRVLIQVDPNGVVTRTMLAQFVWPQSDEPPPRPCRVR